MKRGSGYHEGLLDLAEIQVAASLEVFYFPMSTLFHSFLVQNLFAEGLRVVILKMIMDLADELKISVLSDYL